MVFLKQLLVWFVTKKKSLKLTNIVVGFIHGYMLFEIKWTFTLCFQFGFNLSEAERSKRRKTKWNIWIMSSFKLGGIEKCTNGESIRHPLNFARLTHCGYRHILAALLLKLTNLVKPNEKSSKEETLVSASSCSIPSGAWESPHILLHGECPQRLCVLLNY